MSEVIIKVDFDDNEIGFITKEEAHKSPILHRAFSIFIMNGDKMLIQKRNPNKYHSGGLWTNACCSHPRKGESLEKAVHRRLVEEVGFDCELVEKFSFVYMRQFNENLYEYEYDHVFVGEYSGEVILNEEEATEYMWIDKAELKTRLREKPEEFTTWFFIAASKII